MPVIIEGLAVVIKGYQIIEKYSGGFERFERSIPTPAWVGDGCLVAVPFMDWYAAHEYVKYLVANGLDHLNEAGEAEDLCLVDMQSGVLDKTPWVEFGRAAIDSDPTHVVSFAQVAASVLDEGEERPDRLVTPDFWTWENSLTANFTFIPLEESRERMEVIGEEDGLVQLRDRLTGKTHFIASPRIGINRLGRTVVNDGGDRYVEVPIEKVMGPDGLNDELEHQEEVRKRRATSPPTRNAGDSTDRRVGAPKKKKKT